MEATDEELIREYIDGREESFKSLIDRYTGAIYNFSASLAGKDKAPDIAQEVFIKVWRNINKFKSEKAQFKTWIFAIARNTATDHLRKKKAIIFSDLDRADESFEDNIEDQAILPDEAIKILEEKNILEKLLAKLPTDYQTVLTLYYQEDMTFKEIGEVLGKPLNTVKSHHLRALNQLRKMFLADIL